MSAITETKEPAESADISELLLAPPEQPADPAAVIQTGESDDPIVEAPLTYESQTIDINGVRHEIINQGQDETGQPVVVLKNEETGDHIALPLSALIGEAADAAVPEESLPVDAAGSVPPADESHYQNEAHLSPGETAVSQTDGAALSCVSAVPDDTQSAQPDDQTAQTTSAATDHTAHEIGVDQLQALADQAGVEQQLLREQQPFQQQEQPQNEQQPDVNGINGDISDDSVLQAVGQAETHQSAVSQIAFDPNSVIDVSANGANGSSLEALVAGATVVAGEDGNQFVIIPSEDGAGTGQQINLADVIGDGDGSGQTYLIQTEDGLVACSAPPEVVEKAPQQQQSPIEQIASNEQAILEAVLATGNFSDGQVIHAMSGDQTMAYTVRISSEGAALIPIGPVNNNTAASPKKILGRSRGQGDSVMANRSLTSGSGSQALHRAHARKTQSTVQYGNARQNASAVNQRSQMPPAASKFAPSNQVTVTRINPPSRSLQPAHATSASSPHDSLLTAVTGPSQLSSSRRTYSKKNILWVNPESSTKSSASSDSTGIESKSAAVPALVSTNSNMSVLATTVTSSPVTEKVSPIVKKQNPILTSRTPSKAISPPKQAKESVLIQEAEKKEIKNDLTKSSAPEAALKRAPEKTVRSPQKVQTETPIKKAGDESRKTEASPKKKETEIRVPESEPTRRSNRASKRVSKVEEDVTPAAEVIEDETKVVATVAAVPVDENASQKEVAPEPIVKRSARRSTSTEKREEEQAPPPPKQSRIRGRFSKAATADEPEVAIINDTHDHKEEVPADVQTPEPAAVTPAETKDTVSPAKTPGRRGRKPAEKVPDQADIVEKTVSDSDSAVPETPADSDSSLKASGSVRRSGRAAKRKVEEDFVSEIEPEALGERPSRKSRTEAVSPEKVVKNVKDHKSEKVAESHTYSPDADEPPQTNSNVESDAVVPEKKERKEAIAVTPKKRVGFRDAADDSPTATSSTKKIKKSNVDSDSRRSSTPRRGSTESPKLTPILKPSKETPKGRRLATPIVHNFTPYDKDADCARLRKSISTITEKRSQADHYNISSPNLMIHVRHQSASSTPISGSGTYACQKCGYNTSRINNLTLHHKNQCPVVLSEWQLGWQNELKRLKTRTSTDVPVRTQNLIENDHDDDTGSPVPDSSSALPDSPADLVTNDAPEASGSSQTPGDDHSENAAVTEHEDHVSPITEPTVAAAAPKTTVEICPPSDDEEDMESDSGIVKNNTHLFSDSMP